MSEVKFDEKSLDEQEALNNARLLTLVATKSKVDKPKASSLTELTSWVLTNFSAVIKNPKVFIHNKISMDGSFLRFAEEAGVQITCLFDDGTTSWKTTYGNEQFIGFGVFKIKTDKITFIHSALFHKGVHYEDEVSFFNILDTADFEDYIAFRNRFEEWETKRDSSNLEIEVIGGDGKPTCIDR